MFLTILCFLSWLLLMSLKVVLVVLPLKLPLMSLLLLLATFQTEANPDGEIHIKKIDTKDQLADILTKGLVAAKFQPLRDRLMGWDLNMNPRVSWRI